MSDSDDKKCKNNSVLTKENTTLFDVYKFEVYKFHIFKTVYKCEHFANDPYFITCISDGDFLRNVGKH